MNNWRLFVFLFKLHLKLGLLNGFLHGFLVLHLPNFGSLLLGLLPELVLLELLLLLLGEENLSLFILLVFQLAKVLLMLEQDAVGVDCNGV